mgnify:CR=1 FL=1
MSKKSDQAPSEDWKRRARAAGLTLRTMAGLVRRHEDSIGRALGGARQDPNTSGPYIAIILAWEMMSDKQRRTWLRETAALTEASRLEPAGQDGGLPGSLP